MKQLSKREVRQVAGGQDDGAPIVNAIVGPLPEPVAPAPVIPWTPAPIKNQP